eukprot:403366377
MISHNLNNHENLPEPRNKSMTGTHKYTNNISQIHNNNGNNPQNNHFADKQYSQVNQICSPLLTQVASVQSTTTIKARNKDDQQHTQQTITDSSPLSGSVIKKTASMGIPKYKQGLYMNHHQHKNSIGQSQQASNQQSSQSKILTMKELQDQRAQEKQSFQQAEPSHTSLNTFQTQNHLQSPRRAPQKSNPQNVNNYMGESSQNTFQNPSQQIETQVNTPVSNSYLRSTVTSNSKSVRVSQIQPTENKTQNIIGAAKISSVQSQDNQQSASQNQVNKNSQVKSHTPAKKSLHQRTISQKYGGEEKVEKLQKGKTGIFGITQSSAQKDDQGSNLKKSMAESTSSKSKTDESLRQSITKKKPNKHSKSSINSKMIENLSCTQKPQQQQIKTQMGSNLSHVKESLEIVDYNILKQQDESYPPSFPNNTQTMKSSLNFNNYNTLDNAPTLSMNNTHKNLVSILYKDSSGQLEDTSSYTLQLDSYRAQVNKPDELLQHIKSDTDNYQLNHLFQKSTAQHQMVASKSCKYSIIHDEIIVDQPYENNGHSNFQSNSNEKFKGSKGSGHNDFSKGFCMEKFKELKGEEFQDEILDRDFVSGFVKHAPKGGVFQGYQQKLGSKLSPRVEVQRRINQSKTFNDKRQLNQDLNVNSSHDSIAAKQSQFQILSKNPSSSSIQNPIMKQSQQIKQLQNPFKKQLSSQEKKQQVKAQNKSVSTSRVGLSNYNTRERSTARENSKIESSLTRDKPASHIKNQNRNLLRESSQAVKNVARKDQSQAQKKQFSYYGGKSTIQNQSRQRNLSTASLSKNQVGQTQFKDTSNARKPSIISKRESIQGRSSNLTQTMRPSNTIKQAMSQTMRIVLESPRFTEGLNSTSNQILNQVKAENNNTQVNRQFMDMIEDFDIKSSAREDFDLIQEIEHATNEQDRYNCHKMNNLTTSNSCVMLGNEDYSRHLKDIQKRVQFMFKVYENKINDLNSNVEELQQENKILKRKLYQQQTSKNNNE